MVDKLLVVALEIVVDDIKEIWLVFDLHLLAVMFQQGSENLAVSIVIPFVAVVLELNIMRLRLTVLTVDDGPILYADSSAGHLVGVSPTKGLAIECQGTYSLETLLVELLQFGKIKLALQETCRVLPLADLLLELGFLLDEADGIDTFVHTDGVLPVVGTAGILRVVLDTYSLVGSHVADHDVLLHFTGLIAGLVVCITTLLDTIAREITAGASRVADGHRERSWHIALQ